MTRSRSRNGAHHKQHPALTETLRLLGLPKRKPTDADRPPVSTLPGRKVKPLPGQLELGQDEPEAA
jgi:hypothetical protein